MKIAGFFFSSFSIIFLLTFTSTHAASLIQDEDIASMVGDYDTITGYFVSGGYRNQTNINTWEIRENFVRLLDCQNWVKSKLNSNDKYFFDYIGTCNIDCRQSTGISYNKMLPLKCWMELPVRQNDNPKWLGFKYPIKDTEKNNGWEIKEFNSVSACSEWRENEFRNSVYYEPSNYYGGGRFISRGYSVSCGLYCTPNDNHLEMKKSCVSSF